MEYILLLLVWQRSQNQALSEALVGGATEDLQALAANAREARARACVRVWARARALRVCVCACARVRVWMGVVRVRARARVCVLVRACACACACAPARRTNRVYPSFPKTMLLYPNLSWSIRVYPGGREDRERMKVREGE